MLLGILFCIYFILLFFSIILLGLNMLRVRDRLAMHPKIICFMFPFFLNYFLAQTVFRSIHPFFSTFAPALLMYFLSSRLECIRVIGLTGGIACGKSTLVRLIKSNLENVDIIDCDEISRKLSDKGNKGYKLIVKLLGDKCEEYLNPLTQEIEREKFSAFVFKNPEFRSKLTRGMGKLILMEVGRRVLWNIWKKQSITLIDAPILYETKILQYVCYPVVVVGCSQAEQVARLEKRNGLTEQQAIARIDSQMPLEHKRRKCQIYLDNSGSEEELLRGFLTKIMRYIDKRRATSLINRP